MDHYHHRSRRFQPSSPNTRFLNILLAFATTMCLWNLWVVPNNNDGDDAAILQTTSNGSMNREAWMQQEQPRVLQLQTPEYTLVVPVLSLTGSSNPVVSSAPNSESHTGVVGDSAFRDDSARTRQVQSAEASPKIPSSYHYGTNKHDIADQPRQESLLSESQRPKVLPKASTLQTNAARRVLPTASSYRAVRRPHNSNMGNRRVAPRAFLLLVASVAVVSGAVLAKKAMEGVERWEQQSQEDSLAYDIAYTDYDHATMGTPLRNGWTSRIRGGGGDGACSDIGYGSFVCTTWSDESDKFDL